MNILLNDYSGLWLVMGVIFAGVFSSQLLADKPIALRWLAGDLLRGGIVATIIWAYCSSSNDSISYMLMIAGCSAVAWPHTFSEVVVILIKNVKKIIA